MELEAFVREVETNGWPVYGVEVWQDGRIVGSWGDTERERHPIYSATKTMTSLAVGMAWDAGLLELGESVLRYLPGDVVREMAPEQRDAYRQITLHRLLTMSVRGYPFRPEGARWLPASLALPLTEPETPAFEYSNVPAYLVGVAAACALGEPLDEVLNRRLFTPLGIPRPKCAHDPDGYFYGATGIELTVNELSRIGRLLACGGVWAGERLVSEAYVRAATSLQQMNREGGYGYFVWKYRDGFSINGKWGQKCFVLPALGRMVTYLGNLPENSGAVKACAERTLMADE